MRPCKKIIIFVYRVANKAGYPVPAKMNDCVR